jgi:hypothetical protein
LFIKNWQYECYTKPDSHGMEMASLGRMKVMIETIQINELRAVIIREGSRSLGKPIPAEECVMYLPAITRFG